MFVSIMKLGDVVVVQLVQEVVVGVEFDGDGFLGYCLGVYLFGWFFQGLLGGGGGYDFIVWMMLIGLK